MPNITGAIVGFGCSAVYHSYSQFPPLNLYFLSFALLLVAGTLFMLGNSGALGYLGCSLAVILMGSPLATLKTVLTERSTASLPFFTSVTTWLNALSWMLYGSLIANDPMVIILFHKYFLLQFCN